MGPGPGRRPGGHDDQAVIGDPDTRRTQAVAVQDRAHDGAVGEADRRRAVPRLHERRVVLVERPPGGVHGLAAFPGLGDHHQHRVVQRTSTQVQQLERLVEPRGVRGARRTDRENLVQVVVVPEHVGVDQRLAGPHPVLVAVDGVDLTVVGDPAERCASGHDGNVLVENRECTMPSALVMRSSCRSR